MVKEPPKESDNLLAPWLQSRSEEEAESALAQFIAAHIEPVIKGVVRFKLRLDLSEGSEAVDIAQEALTQWLAELRKFREMPDQHPIGDARGLAATITYRVCYRWLRRQTPQRNALRARLQYALTRQSGLALWPDADKNLIAGFAAWRGSRDRAPVEKLRRLSDDEKFLWTGYWRDAKLKDFLVAIFDFVGGPVAFDDLVSATAAVLQIRDNLPASVEEQAEAGGAVMVSHEDVARRVEKRIFLQRLWEEVRELPRPQRAALLLNLREADGRGCLALFPATGVATLRQLAETLEIPAERLAELWNQLPLDDAGIAEALNLTRQQVINLRKSARSRLTRRLKGFF